MTTPNIQFPLHSRHRGLSAHRYLQCRVYESAVDWTFPRIAGRPAGNADKDLLIPVLMDTLGQSGPDKTFDSLVDPVANDCERLRRIGDPRQLAIGLLWACSVQASQEAQQPHYHWSWLKVIEALDAAFGPRQIKIPFNVSMSRVDGLLAAHAIASPDGTPVVLLNHNVVFINDYAWIRYRLERENEIWKNESPGNAAVWNLTAFLGLAQRLLLPDYCVDARVSLPSPPNVDVAMTDKDNYLINRLGETITSFVILHEFGHIIHGHLEEPAADPDRSRKMEFEADNFALEVLECRPSFRTYDLFVVCMLLNDLARARALAGLPAASESHPCHLERVLNLLLTAKRVSTDDKDVLRQAFADLSDFDRTAARGLLVPRSLATEPIRDDYSPARFRVPSAVNPREAEVIEHCTEHPESLSLWPPPDSADQRNEMWRMTQMSGAMLEITQKAIRMIVTDPELRPPFEIAIISINDSVVHFSPERLDSGAAESKHSVPLLFVRLELGGDQSYRVKVGEVERQPYRAIVAEWESHRPRIRHLAVTFKTETRFYEAGPGLIMLVPNDELADRFTARFDEMGNMLLTILEPE